jgi:lipopolysaccharide/colanic/teichoic acid biosynthesis glycosyltransferase
MCAVLVRDNFEVSTARWQSMIPFFVTAFLSATFVFPCFGSHRGIWGFTTSAQLPRLLMAAVAVTALTMFILFSYDRLSSVPRSLPVLHGLFLLCGLCGVRLFARHRTRMRRARRVRRQDTYTSMTNTSVEPVLVAGQGPLLEVYLQAVAELAPTRVRIVGVVTPDPNLVGQGFGAHPVLGTIAEIRTVVRDLVVHGVEVKTIVTTVGREEIDAAPGVVVRSIGEELGLVAPSSPTLRDASRSGVLGFQFSDTDLGSIARRPYWRAKRVVDCVAAAASLVVLAPLMVVIAAFVAATGGRPVTFWQQRPGRYGMPIRVRKFRTMIAAFDSSGRPCDDAARVSTVGAFLRRTRLDELPQLLNVLVGDMSFVGPRPLLPRDQPDAFRARLIVRPGLTGWAQVVGGRALSAEDKAALDIWYVCHASFWLDLAIVARTLTMLLTGERMHDDLIARAWSDLLAKGVVVGDLVDAARERVAS